LERSGFPGSSARAPGALLDTALLDPEFRGRGSGRAQRRAGRQSNHTVRLDRSERLTDRTRCLGWGVLSRSPRLRGRALGDPRGNLERRGMTQRLAASNARAGWPTQALLERENPAAAAAALSSVLDSSHERR